MLARSVVEAIDRLLKEGKLSNRQIAEEVGVSRTSVNAIARGWRGLFGRGRDPESDACDTIEPSVRCPKCGFQVHLPCLVCRTREYREQQKYMKKLGGEAAARRGRRRSVNRGRGQPRRARVA
jgi:DNA-binding XRE family transcriptional regulator